MRLYKTISGSLERVKIKPFQLEKEIQTIVESNVSNLFDLEFIKSELTFGNFRFDTLCFDNETNSFVIIEYKKGSSYSVIDQGYTYLSLLLNNKSDFILEYNETLDKNIKRDEVDWSQSKVIFISPQFTDYQKNSVNFKNLPFELWGITRYSDDSIGLSKISTESVVDINSTIGDDTTNGVVGKVSKEVIRYDEEFHISKSKNRPEHVIELYRRLKTRILEMGENIEIRFGKQTIGFSQNKVFTDLILYNKGVGVVLNLKKGELNDSLNKTEDLSDKGHWGSGDYRIWLNDEDDFEYTLSLIRQSYQNQL
jgi:predicted transport protein